MLRDWIDAVRRNDFAAAKTMIDGQALNGEVLDDVADFYRKLWAIGPAGTPVMLRMERDNDAFEVTVRTGDRSSYHKFGADN